MGKYLPPKYAEHNCIALRKLGLLYGTIRKSKRSGFKVCVISTSITLGSGFGSENQIY